jgi:acyl-CoA synthetase (AMP-forming)/AMP-acid ligase II
VNAIDTILGGLAAGSTGEVSAEGERLHSEALSTLVDRLARKLARLGARPGEPVHVRIGNRPADLAALFAVWRVDAVAVPEHVATPDRVAAALRARTGARFLMDQGTVAEIAATPPPRRPLLEGAALIVFTSGSTGEPKGVVVDRGRFAAKIRILAGLLGIDASDTVLVPLQLTFIFGIWVSVLSIGVGARLVLMPRFTPATAAEFLTDHVSVMACVPTMLRSLVAEPPTRAGRLRAILTGGEPLGEALTISLGRTFQDAGIGDLYGLTETGSCDFHLMPKDQPAGIGSIGVPTEQVTYRIADAAEGIGGELQINTPFGMLGYLDAPELTRTAFADGYFKTGDLARVRPDGRVELVGRAKDIISRGGYKIAPLEVEGLLARHPDVAAALCAGVPHGRLGECIHAVVVPRAGTAPDAQSIRAWASDRIEHYKLPDVIHLRESLPLGRTGKADRAAIAAIAAQS